ncbi:FixH family protein [Marinobacter shengliensis]|uniref:FixH family protein n=1 Tax=Marinobacter shengliensis TaxID=1389223 RepID=UPI001E475A00|nr:FixH family protein [Marinobacter shengliensis]MCD1628395.1 FixH family protein [Marinobacter shengliensis]
MTDNTPVAPWYRQPWFWFLTIFPIAAIISGMTILTVGSILSPSMVTDDYSREGRGINMAIARDQKALDLGLKGGLTVDERSARLTLESNEGAADYPYLVLNLYHPTMSERDRTIQFRRMAAGEYTGNLVEDMDGRWYYDLQGPDNDWRVKGEFWLPASDKIALKATSSTQG